MKIVAKTDKELALMREGGLMLQKTQQELLSVIEAGISLKQLDSIAEKFILKQGARPAFKGFHGFPATICAMLNSEVVHGIPDDRVLRDGDLLSIDCGLFWQDYCADAAFSLVVGGDDKNKERAKFSKVVKQALDAGCQAAKIGNFLGDIGFAVQNVVEKNGYSIVRDYGGHGIGKNMHEDPFVPNYGKKGSGVRLVAGMTLAIEPIVAMGKSKTKTLKDGWTVVTIDGKDAIQWEHFGVVTESGFEIFA